MIVTCLSCDHDEQHQEVKQNEVCQEKELSPWCSTQESGQNNAAMGKDKEDWANSFSTNTACNLEVVVMVMAIKCNIFSTALPNPRRYHAAKVHPMERGTAVLSNYSGLLWIPDEPLYPCAGHVEVVNCRR